MIVKIFEIWNFDYVKLGEYKMFFNYLLWDFFVVKRVKNYILATMKGAILNQTMGAAGGVVSKLGTFISIVFASSRNNCDDAGIRIPEAFDWGVEFDGIKVQYVEICLKSLFILFMQSDITGFSQQG